MVGSVLMLCAGHAGRCLPRAAARVPLARRYLAQCRDACGGLRLAKPHHKSSWSRCAAAAASSSVTADAGKEGAEAGIAMSPGPDQQPAARQRQGPNFQDAITRLQAYWSSKGCAVCLPHNTEVLPRMPSACGLLSRLHASSPGPLALPSAFSRTLLHLAQLRVENPGIECCLTGRNAFGGKAWFCGILAGRCADFAAFVAFTATGTLPFGCSPALHWISALCLPLTNTAASLRHSSAPPKVAADLGTHAQMSSSALLSSRLLPSPYVVLNGLARR